jgi:hypothetical protein
MWAHGNRGRAGTSAEDGESNRGHVSPPGQFVFDCWVADGRSQYCASGWPPAIPGRNRAYSQSSEGGACAGEVRHQLNICTTTRHRASSIAQFQDAEVGAMPASFRIGSRSKAVISAWSAAPRAGTKPHRQVPHSMPRHAGKYQTARGHRSNLMRQPGGEDIAWCRALRVLTECPDHSHVQVARQRGIRIQWSQ